LTKAKKKKYKKMIRTILDYWVEFDQLATYPFVFNQSINQSINQPINQMMNH